jgi:hypothetical protein
MSQELYSMKDFGVNWLFRCSVVVGYRRFGGLCYLHFHFTLDMMTAAWTSETLVTTQKNSIWMYKLAQKQRMQMKRVKGKKHELGYSQNRFSIIMSKIYAAPWNIIFFPIWKCLYFIWHIFFFPEMLRRFAFVVPNHFSENLQLIIKKFYRLNYVLMWINSWQNYKKKLYDYGCKVCAFRQVVN